MGKGGDRFMGKFGTGEGKIGQFFSGFGGGEEVNQADPGEIVENPPIEGNGEETPTNEASNTKNDDPWIKFMEQVQRFGERSKDNRFQYKSLTEMRGGRRGR